MSLGSPNSPFGSLQVAPNAPHEPGLQPQQEPHAQPQPQQDPHAQPQPQQELHDEPVRQPQQHWSKPGFPVLTIHEGQKWEDFPEPLLNEKPRNIAFGLLARTLIQNFLPCGIKYKNRWVYIPESILQIGKAGSAVYMKLGGGLVDCVDDSKVNKPTRFRVVEQNGTKTLQQLHSVDSNTSEEVWKPAIDPLTYHDFYETKFDEFIVQSGPKSSDDFNKFCTKEGISNYRLFGSLWWTANAEERKERAGALEAAAAAAAVGGGKGAVEDAAAISVETQDTIEDDDDNQPSEHCSANDGEDATAAKRTSKETGQPSGLQEAAKGKNPTPNASDIARPRPEDRSQENATHGGGDDEGREKSLTARVLFPKPRIREKKPLPYIPALSGWPNRKALMEQLRFFTEPTSTLTTAAKYIDFMLSLLLIDPPDSLKQKIDALSALVANSQMEEHMHWIRDCRNALDHEPPVMTYAQLGTNEETVLEIIEDIVCYLEVLHKQKQETDGLRNRIRQLEHQVQETDELRSRIRFLEGQLRSGQHGNGGFPSPQAHHHDSAGRQHLNRQRNNNHYPHGSSSGDRRTRASPSHFSGNRVRNEWSPATYGAYGPQDHPESRGSGGPAHYEHHGSSDPPGSAGLPSQKRKRDT